MYFLNLSWFFAFDFMKNMKHACDRKFTEVYVCQNYQNTAWSDKVTAKIKWCSFFGSHGIYTVFQKSDAEIQITITTTYLIGIKYSLNGLKYHLSDVNVANFNKIHRKVSEQTLF